MTHYVDGFVLPVPRAKVDAYRALAQKAGAIWKEHGALQFWECIAEDVKSGEFTSFPQAVKLQDDELVMFSFIVFASRAERDRINALVMQDPRLTDSIEPETVPFDAKRMIYGGFATLVEL